MKTSTKLNVGQVYTRAVLKSMFKITDATINNGIFQPTGHESLWLFITEKKTPDRPQYNDLLKGDDLRWESQPRGRKDHLIVGHVARGLEVLVFYRRKQNEFKGSGFKYEGRFYYVSHQPGQPSQFHLRRMEKKTKPPSGKEDEV